MKTVLVYFPFVVWLVALVAFVRPLSSRRGVRWAWGLGLLACAAKFVLFERFGGSAFNPEAPAPVIWVTNVLYSGFMLLAAFAFVAWCCRIKGRLLWLLPVLAWGLAVKGVWNGLQVPAVHEIELSYANLPSDLEGYRIVHLTDLHVSASARRWRTEAIVRQANDLKPDLIVCTGDIVDGKVATEGDDVAPLCDLTAPDGVYFCAGNHEYYLDSENWFAQYRDWNICFLENACALPRPSLAVGGIPDSTGARKECADEPDVAKAFAVATNGEFRVLLAHRPSDPHAGTPQTAYDLQLSGHTHGGIMPFLYRLVKLWNHDYVRGLYAVGERTRLYVSPGAGQWAGFPIRFCDDSEITLITLHGAKSP